MPRLKLNKIVSLVFLVFFLLFLPFFNTDAQLLSSPNDPYYKNQWYLKQIGFNYVWNYPFRGQSPVIAVIDSGIDIEHSDLLGNIWLNNYELEENGVDDDNNGFIDDLYGWNFVENNNNPRPKLNTEANEDGLNHGTMIAGIISAQTNNGMGVSGIASKSKIMALRALDEKGEGKVNDVVRAIDYAISNGADIINLSFAGNSYNQGFEDAVKRASRAGVIIVSSVGNDNFNLNKNSSYPACFENNTSCELVVGVAALDSMDQKTNFSSYGSRCVDISAPGVSFFSTSFYDYETKKYKEYSGYWSGTSMASAVVSGVLGAIKQVNPKLNKKELLDVFFKSADNISNLNYNHSKDLGIGRVNAYSSIGWADEKWENISGRFLFHPQSEVKDYKNENNIYKIYFSDQKGEILESFSVYGDDYRGGVNIAAGDLDGDGIPEIITGAGPGGGPHIRIFDNQGNIKGQFFAYDSKFRGGVNIAVGDLDGDGIPEIITGAGPGGGPHIKIFDNQGNIKGQFFAYDSKFRGGVNIAVGDLDGDGIPEIITGAGPGGGPHIRIFDNQGNIKGQFFAYENNFYGGVKVLLANIYGKDTKNRKEIVVSPGAGRLPEIKIFDSLGKKRKSFLAYSENFKNGVNISIGDLNKDGLDEIITGAGPGGAPHIRAFNSDGALLVSFYALDEKFSGGVSVSYIEVNN